MQLFYQDHFDAVLHSRCTLAQNHVFTIHHAIDAPFVTFVSLTRGHGTPHDCVWSGCSDLWKEVMQNCYSVHCEHVSFTFVQGAHNAQVSGTEIQEGGRVGRQPWLVFQWSLWTSNSWQVHMPQRRIGKSYVKKKKKSFSCHFLPWRVQQPLEAQTTLHM